MTLVVRRGSSWDPFSTLSRQFDNDFDQLVRRAFGPNASGPGTTGFVPAIDVHRDGTDVVVTAELPGAENLDVEVADGRLRISGRRGTQRSQEADGALVREIRSGEFRREFALPEHVTADNIEADYTDGLLTVRVHEVTKPKPEPRKIAVRGVAEVEAAPTEVEGSAGEK